MPTARGRGRRPSLAALRSFLRSGLGPLYSVKRRLTTIFGAPHEPDASGRGRSPSLAVLLSFLWPGLGQLYLRNRRAAAIFAVPAVLVTLLLAYELRQGLWVFTVRFVDPSFSRDAAVIVILLGFWRLAAVGHAFVRGERRPDRKILDRAVLVALAAVIIMSHAGAGYLLAETSKTGEQIFGSPNPSLIDLRTFAPSPEASATPGPTPTPVVTPSIDHRVTILFTAVGTESPTQYDAIMVVSYDPKTNSVQMVSVPRDIASFPLYFGGYVSASTRLAYLPEYVSDGYIRSPSGDSPYRTLINEVSYLIGIPIDYYAAMDMGTFEKMIDKVGGIDVVNPTDINDVANSSGWPGYDWGDGTYGFTLAAGPQHLDGGHAMAYVRSRNSAGDNNFGRDSRQQQVLVALLHKMAQPDQILALPDLLSMLRSSVSTNFPPDKVADYMAVGQDVPSDHFTHVLLSVGKYSNYMGAEICLYNSNVADLSKQLFGQDSLWNGKTPPANTCS